MIDAQVFEFIVIRLAFLLLFGLLVLPLHYVFRIEWNRAAILSAALSVVAVIALEFVPTQTHVVRLDLPRTN